MNKGKVKFYDETKGFGFIIDDNSGEEYFVHHSGISEDEQIKENDIVEYNVIDGRKGPNAVDVKVV
ncbi:cold-shock protein [Candidatus Gracilibacteria bacterium]|nr:MAG: cold-shock protein [Candidatus Gracilibacteria bacterium]PIE85758.1 MAG: cold-shock protein [Candidatus Gracilibacteria bacterium]